MKIYNLPLFLIGLVIMLMSFKVLIDQVPSNEERIKNWNAAEDSEARSFRTITLEGHDYFICPTTHGRFVLTHKGNCSGCGTLKAENGNSTR